MAGKLAHRVLHDGKKSTDGGSRCHGETDDCLQGTLPLIPVTRVSNGKGGWADLIL